MKITKLSLTNFRAFKTEQTIEFAPTTLLFGANSVGKSSILVALAYLQQILQKGQCNPKRLDALGGKYVGGFESLVYGRDVSQQIVIGVEFEPGSSIPTEYETYAETYDHGLDYLAMQDVAGNADKYLVNFTIAYSASHKVAYVRRYDVWVNDLFAGTIVTRDGHREGEVESLNYIHPLLIPTYNEHAKELQAFAETQKISDPTILRTELVECIADLYPGEHNSEGAGFYGAIPNIALETFAGALPKLGTMLKINLDGEDPGEGERHLNHQVVTRVLTQVFVSPLDLLSKFLDKSAFIGPLRVVPEDYYEPNPYPAQADWFNGTAAWDLLHNNQTNGDYDALFQEVKKWLADEDRLDSGYVLRRIYTHEVMDGYIDSEHEIPESELDIMDDRKHGRPKLWFWDKNSQTDLSPSQVGVGLSQVLPLLTAAHHVKSGMVSIEQPELHIHPAFQVVLGDLFTQLNVPSNRRPQFLVETHSEHLVLRLLRRVRETSDSSLEVNAKPLKPEEISVIYLEHTKEGVIVIRIEIDEEGEFKQRWPKGFFAERRKELM